MPELLPLEDAVKRINAKTPIGSLLRSADWEDVPVGLRERAQFSAGVTSAKLLQTIQDRLSKQFEMQREALANGKEATFDRSSFIDQVRDIARDEGLGGGGGLTDITSIPRLGLIYDMQNQQATGFARWKMDQGEGALLLYPAWQFVRVEDRRVPRNQAIPGFWERRWIDAANAAGDSAAVRVLSETGRMVALKTSGLWSKLSKFGTPWAPFDWGSGMGVEEVERDEAVQLGLMKQDEVLESGEKKFNDELEASVSGIGPELLGFLKQTFGGKVSFDGERVSWAGQEEVVKPKPKARRVVPESPRSKPDEQDDQVEPALEQLGRELRKKRFNVELVTAMKGTPRKAARMLSNAHFNVARSGAYYQRGDRSVHINRDPKHWSGRPQTLHHELGHHLHFESGMVTNEGIREDFKRAMTADLEKFKTWAAEKFGPNWKATFRQGNGDVMLPALAKAIGLNDYDQLNDLDGAKRVSAVADTLMGLSKAELGMGHSVSYMLSHNHHAMEVFAHSYSAMVLKDAEFENLFPNVVAVVRKEFQVAD
jgi:hypothetical protein